MSARDEVLALLGVHAFDWRAEGGTEKCICGHWLRQANANGVFLAAPHSSHLADVIAAWAESREGS